MSIALIDLKLALLYEGVLLTFQVAFEYNILVCSLHSFCCRKESMKIGKQL